MAAPPVPTFILHGMSVTAIGPFPGGRGLIVMGTNKGRALIYDVEIHQEIETIYEDAEGRVVVAVGCLDCHSVWIHVRNHGILRMEKSNSENDVTWTVANTVPVGHYGYCAATVLENDRVVYPDMQNSNHQLRVWSTSSELPEDRPMTSFGDKITPLSLTAKGSTVYCGDDSGSLNVWDTQTGNCEKITLGIDPIFSVSVSAKRVAVGSAKSPIRLLGVFPVKGEEPMAIHYLASAGGCGHLSFSSSGKSLLAGFWDGSIRVFSVARQSVLLVLHFHSGPISCLRWITVEEGRGEMVVSSAADEKLCFWKLK